MMRPLKALFFAAFVLASPTFASTNEVISCAADLAAAVAAGRVGARFDITAADSIPTTAPA